MKGQSRARRRAGTGSLLIRTDRSGRRTYYGKFRVGERQVKRRLGSVREQGGREGLTCSQAETELRRLIEREGTSPRTALRTDLAAAAESHIHHVEHVRGRKPTT